MMEPSRIKKTSTLIWTIKNVDKLFQEDFIFSPYFSEGPYQKNQWYLILVTENHNGFTEIVLQYQENQHTMKNAIIGCEISMLQSNESDYKIVYSGSKIVSSRGSIAFPIIKKDEFCNLKKEFYPDNRLEVRCRLLYRFETKYQVSKLCCGFTILTQETGVSVWCVQNVSSLELGEKRSKCVRLDLSSFPEITVTLSLMEDGNDLQIELKKHNSKMQFLTYWKIAVVDIYGQILRKRFVYWEMEGENDSVNLTHFIKKSELLANKASYLPNDSLILSLNCMCTQQSCSVFESTQNGQQHDYSQSSIAYRNSYIKNFPRDVNLQVGSEIFPAHKVILALASSLFMNMFFADTKESEEDCVELKDIDPDTLRRMLEYIYTETIEDERFDSVVNLYSAADKYKLLTLKEKCTELLKDSISISNACELFVLADKHSDENFKSFVETFFLIQRSEMLRSKEWEKFRKYHLRLACQVMQNLILQIR